ncbi:uncharacterized protein METZ01_LOCUS291187 [marine metagenome]|uniref:Uncharacterized protein n=1 Tax=marine metagenome TaxID=408172 RepID=A0A382LPQ4_9ZZZZ
MPDMQEGLQYNSERQSVNQLESVPTSSSSPYTPRSLQLLSAGQNKVAGRGARMVEGRPRKPLRSSITLSFPHFFPIPRLTNNMLV